jgi:hypothetical protein
MCSRDLDMLDAWQLEHRPVLYFFLRRFELIRWTLSGKVFHSEASRLALWRSLWLALIGYETERCSFCGWKVGLVWWCDSTALWERVTGFREGGGICCVKCFERRANKTGIALRWKPDLLSKVSGE